MNGPTDEELDRDWKPSGRRPQSTIARSFSQELMDIFRIENSVADLDEKVDKRKQHVTAANTELEALEARLREMEERLRRSQQAGSAGFHRPGAIPPPAADVSSSSSRVPPSHNGHHRAPPSSRRYRDDAPPPPLPKDRDLETVGADKARSRPGTARQGQHVAPGSGAMPPTPVASEGEYELVDKAELLDEDDRPPPPPRRRAPRET